MTVSAQAGMTVDGAVRRSARAALTLAVRGRRERGGPWGEAVLAEFAHTRGRLEALRWAAGGIRAALRERRARNRELPRWVRIGRRAAAAVAIGVACGAVILQWVVTPMYTPSGSMAPTLRPGDNWLMDRVSFHLTGLHYGDVVAFEQPIDGGNPFTAVRRVIGLPGDVIGCRAGQTWRNGTPVPDPSPAPDRDSPLAPCTPMTVPEESLYVLGDHRMMAMESNPVAVDRIEGRLMTRLWNTDPSNS